MVQTADCFGAVTGEAIHNVTNVTSQFGLAAFEGK